MPQTISINKKSHTIPQNTQLYSWAFIHYEKISKLAKKTLEEDWGESREEGREYPKYPTLYNYLAHTFQRLVYEQKVLFATDAISGEEYASFNTGLVDKSYEWIYALFKANTRYEGSDWFLLDFVIAGESAGKTLNSIFEKLPERANYFGNSISNILFDTNQRVCCDYEHILKEHADRLPPSFIKQSCPSLALIDGIYIDDVFSKPPSDKNREEYYTKLSKNLDELFNYNQLKNRFDDALSLAIRRVEWNYKTAIPTYYPKANRGALLLPLSLTTPKCVDVALVVTKEPSGAYQGQTILPLDIAYKNSRLVARLDSEWLNPNITTQ